MGIFTTIIIIWLGFVMMRLAKKLEQRQTKDRQRQYQQEMIDDAFRQLEVRASSQENLDLKPRLDEMRAESVLEDFKDMLYMTKGGRFGG